MLADHLLASLDGPNQKEIDAAWAKKLKRMREIDGGKIDGLLHEAVRCLLLRSLRERLFADTLVDIDKLKTTYQVFDAKGNLI